VAQKRSVQNLNNKAAITLKRYEIGCQLLLITNRMSHMGFRLILTSMTLNDLERRTSPYCEITDYSIRFCNAIYIKNTAIGFLQGFV